MARHSAGEVEDSDRAGRLGDLFGHRLCRDAAVGVDPGRDEGLAMRRAAEAAPAMTDPRRRRRSRA